MNPELRTRSILIALLLAAWAGLIYAKSVLPAFVLADLNSLISYIQVLLGGIVGYHVGAPASPAVPASHAASEYGTPVPVVPGVRADKYQGGFVSLRLLVLAAVASMFALSGCGTLSAFEGQFENGVYCSVAKDKLVVVSDWGALPGIASKIRDIDRAAICR